VKKGSFFVLFLAMQILLLFFYIYHQSMLIKLSYQKQKLEKKKLALSQKRQELKQALHAQHDLAQIKDFAVQSKMRKITLNQVKTVPNEHAAT
jgi:predicted membrane protein